jgi:hypothetical protein
MPHESGSWEGLSDRFEVCTINYQEAWSAAGACIYGAGEFFNRMRLRDDLDELLTCWRYKSLAERQRVHTTNAIERRFREVRRRDRLVGVFSD